MNILTNFCHFISIARFKTDIMSVPGADGCASGLQMGRAFSLRCPCSAFFWPKVKMIVIFNYDNFFCNILSLLRFQLNTVPNKYVPPSISSPIVIIRFRIGISKSRLSLGRLVSYEPNYSTPNRSLFIYDLKRKSSPKSILRRAVLFIRTTGAAIRRSTNPHSTSFRTPSDFFGSNALVNTDRYRRRPPCEFVHPLLLSPQL